MQKRDGKRLLSFVTAILLALSFLVLGQYMPGGSLLSSEVFDAKNDAEDENVATAVLTDEFKTTNFAEVRFAEVRIGTSDKIKYFSRQGAKSWFMDNNSKQESSFMYFNLSDSFANCVDDGTAFDLEFEYYSQNNGFFRIIYDSQRKEEKNGEIIYVGDEKNWKTARISIDDAYFGNRVLGEYDFILSIQGYEKEGVFSAASIAVKNVRVTKYPKCNPITNYCSIEDSGNTFSDFSETKVVYNNLKNTTDKEMTAELVSSAVTEGGKEKWSGRTKVTLSPYEEKSVPVNIETKWCDVYEYRSKIVGDGFESEFKPLKFVIVKTDPDGIRNERYYTNIHPERYLDTAPGMGEVLAKMNCRGVRFVFTWKMVQWRQEYTMAFPEDYRAVLESLSDNGINIMCCLDDQFPTGAPSPLLKENTASMEQWKRALDMIVANMPDGTIYEVTNEPMWAFVTYGDPGDVTPDNLAMLTERTVDYLHEIKPGVKVGVWSLCAMSQDKVYNDYFLPAMQSEYNMCENADAFAMHPYTQIPIERSNTIRTPCAA